jgi:hypothetical protein
MDPSSSHLFVLKGFSQLIPYCLNRLRQVVPFTRVSMVLFDALYGGTVGVSRQGEAIIAKGP